MIMSMQLIDNVLEHDLSSRKTQNVEWDSVVPGGVAIEQIGLHPRRVSWVLHKEMIEVRMVTNPLNNQVPITKKGRITGLPDVAIFSQK